MRKFIKVFLLVNTILNATFIFAAEVKFTPGNLYEVPYIDQEKVYLELDTLLNTFKMQVLKSPSILIVQI